MWVQTDANPRRGGWGWGGEGALNPEPRPEAMGLVDAEVAGRKPDAHGRKDRGTDEPNGVGNVGASGATHYLVGDALDILLAKSGALPGVSRQKTADDARLEKERMRLQQGCRVWKRRPQSPTS